MKDFFMFRKPAIKYIVKKAGKYDMHPFENLLIKTYEENDYYGRISEGKRTDFFPERAGRIPIMSNVD